MVIERVLSVTDCTCDTDRANELITFFWKIWEVLLDSIVLEIEHCNYYSSTRNSS